MVSCTFLFCLICLWPSTHVALSNESVFLDLSCEHNTTVRNMTVSLVDVETNVTMLSRPVTANQPNGALEFNCIFFRSAGSFKFILEDSDPDQKNGTQLWSQVLHVQWPTFHISVERSSNQSSNSFRIGISTSDNFQPCISTRTMSLYVEIKYLEYNQIRRNSIDKVRAQMRRDIQVVCSQHVELHCVFPFTERDYITVALKSSHSQRDIKTSGPLYLSRLFPYKLLVDNVYRTGCESSVAVRLLPPPCASASGKIFLYREGGLGAASSAEETSSSLAFRWLTQGENETKFNCSVFDPGRNKYCFRFVLNSGISPSLSQTCIVVQRSAETWGQWQPWSSCSVSCGEGVRERVRPCLLPPTGGLGCTGMVKEQSHCSLEDCTAPVPSLSPMPPDDTVLGGNLVAVVGISLCLVVIVATVLVTVWRKACHTPECSAVQRGTLHSPGGRKNSDEASICGRSLQRPSFSESLQASAPSHQQSQPLPQPQQDPDRISPTGQKIVPPIFGYRLAQQQLKEMKRKGLKEATKVYHVSQSPIDDTMMETTSSTPVALTPVPPDSESQEEANLHRFRIKTPFMEAPRTAKASAATAPDRLSPKADPVLGTPLQSYSSQAQRHERVADWVEMVERVGGGYLKNPSFRRTTSFHEAKPPPPPRPFRERSMTQVTPRQVPEGSCRTSAWIPRHNPERQDSGHPKAGPADDMMDSRQQARSERTYCHLDSGFRVTAGLESNAKLNYLGNQHKEDIRPNGSSLGPDRAERAELNWSKRGPSPIQRNMLARKLREAGSSATCQRPRATVVSQADFRREKCRSLPLSPDYSGFHGYHGSQYGLTESEQRMMDLSGYLAEEDSVEVLEVHKLT
uniref:Thrombospondin, type I, domain containing 1 n=1 Tax=Scleropages formosus TaxID=113540 RepID=A0A8C9WBE0_SCLFO